jgi:hypothetical protein
MTLDTQFLCQFGMSGSGVGQSDTPHVYTQLHDNDSRKRSSMTKTLLAVTLAALSFAAGAESPVTYVGEGRYTCRGNSAQCAQIDQNNRRESDYRAQQYQQAWAHGSRTIVEHGYRAAHDH